MFFTGKRPKDLGIQNGKLATCPNKPNCVNSQEKNGSHFIEPIKVDGPPEFKMENIKSAVNSLDGAKIITVENGYLHAECKSSLLGFVDDLEIAADKNSPLYHVRSASRIGYSDMGVNRKRVETLRRLLSSD